MAKGGTLDCLAKRDLFGDGQASPARLKAEGEIFLAAGWRYDAVNLLGRAGEAGQVTRLAEEALAEGDLFLYLHALKAVGRQPEPEDLLNLAAAAQARGWRAYAERARQMAQPPARPT